MICRKCKKPIPEESLFCLHCGASQAEPAAHPKKRGNGQGTICRLPSGKWQAIVTLGYVADESGKLHRKKRTKVFAKKSDAIAALPSLKSIQHPADMSLLELYKIYTSTDDYKNLSLSSRTRYEIAWRRIKGIEYAGIASLTVSDIETQIKKQATSYQTAFEMLCVFSHLYKIAMKNEIVQYNKCASVDLPFDKPKAKRQVWTQKEIDTFWADLPDIISTYIIIMSYSGLRFGELASIKISDIHLSENYMIGGIKSEAGTHRQIPIHARIKPLIAEIILKNKSRLLEINKQSFYSMYWDTIKRLNLRQLPPHTCRHYFFSRLTAEGIQGGIIAEVGGHADYLTTLKNYVRIPLEDKLSAVNKI